MTSLQFTIKVDFFATVSAGYIITGHSLSHSLDQFFQNNWFFQKGIIQSFKQLI